MTKIARNFLLLVGVILLSSCGKSHDKKILGAWEFSITEEGVKGDFVAMDEVFQQGQALENHVNSR